MFFRFQFGQYPHYRFSTVEAANERKAFAKFRAKMRENGIEYQCPRIVDRWAQPQLFNAIDELLDEVKPDHGAAGVASSGARPARDIAAEGG